MAIMTARQGQHDLIQYLKNPKVRERHAIDNPLHVKQAEQRKSDEGLPGGPRDPK